eukprot:TRINITY_DN18880_c0_g1_i1.p1 TRINITY_DN18880_c0_g1~~TRINITY_DN18880_c0_g1_i1.p1  ORF type:complete len:453 (+),score=61.49 TRINITY_DN18880_c0_g1_i1:69-1427(+)
MVRGLRFLALLCGWAAAVRYAEDAEVARVVKGEVMPPPASKVAPTNGVKEVAPEKDMPVAQDHKLEAELAKKCSGMRPPPEMPAPDDSDSLSSLLEGSENKMGSSTVTVHEELLFEQRLSSDTEARASLDRAMLERRTGRGGSDASLLELDTSVRRKEGQPSYTCDQAHKQEFAEEFGVNVDACHETSHANFSNSREMCETNNVLYLYPAEDHNDAFCVNTFVCGRMAGWHKNACSVQLYRVQSVAEAVDVVLRFPDSSIRHVVLGGHGWGWGLQWGPVERCGEGLFCAGEVESKYLLGELAIKMQRHGSFFVDSCLGATSDPEKHWHGMNLAEWVAKVVERGIRVIGAELSFSTLRVKRYAGFYGTIEVDEQDNVQRLYSHGATCPSWAESETPDADGQCSCRDYQICTTSDGGDCPSAHGETSDLFFLPACAEKWSNEKCECILDPRALW